MRSLETTFSDLEFWKQLPSLALGNDFWETNVGELKEVTEFAATVGSCSNCEGLPVMPTI